MRDWAMLLVARAAMASGIRTAYFTDGSLARVCTGWLFSIAQYLKNSKKALDSNKKRTRTGSFSHHKARRKRGPLKGTRVLRPLKAVVHVELDRMRRHAETGHFLHLQLDIGVDHGVGEHAAFGQEAASLVQVFQRLVQAVADGRNLRVFLRRQVIQVLGGGFAGVDLVLHAVQARHQHSRETEIRVADRVWEAHFEAAALRVGD